MVTLTTLDFVIIILFFAITLSTDIVRKNGVSGNLVWWAFLITGLLTVFIYAKLWRKSNCLIFFIDKEMKENKIRDLIIT